jgi:BirA family biotin operon repressor/biotin-[acetyl-CoA-carboxylase] ligase
VTATSPAPAIGCRLHTLDAVDSTQTVAAALAAAGAPEGTVVRARHQTAGRGRRGRSWWDAPGDSLLVSVVLRPGMPLERVPGLSLVVAVAAAEALDRRGVSVRLRWPNDLVVADAKLGGVLCEVSARDGGPPAHVIAGLGVNLNQSAFPPELTGRATSLRLLTGRLHPVEDVLAAVLAALERRYREFLAGGLAESLAAWRARSATLGRRVRTPDGEATAVDVAPDGALVVQEAGGRMRTLSAGEIVHAAGG